MKKYKVGDKVVLKRMEDMNITPSNYPYGMTQEKRTFLDGVTTREIEEISTHAYWGQMIRLKGVMSSTGNRLRFAPICFIDDINEEVYKVLRGEI